jgi:hypothetical protein
MDYKLRFCYAEVRAPWLWLSPSSDDSSESYSSLLDASSPLLLESPEDEPLPLELAEPEPLLELKLAFKSLASSREPSSEPSLAAVVVGFWFIILKLVSVLGTCTDINLLYYNLKIIIQSLPLIR